MRILWNEIKKILTWKMLLLLILVNAVLYYFLIEYDIENFLTGRPTLDLYNISIEMKEQYGIDIDEQEKMDFKKTYEEQVEEANQYLQSRNEFVDAGMGTYEEFRSAEFNDLRSRVMFEDRVDLFWELEAREYIIEQIFDEREAVLDGWIRNISTKQSERIDELKKSGALIEYPNVAFRNYQSFIRNVAITIFISVIMVISPMIIKDRSRRMLDLQYTTRKGRHLYKYKVVAGIISAFIVISALLTVYFSIYTSNNTSIFFDFPIHKFHGSPSWYDPTFLQYIVLSVIAIYLLGIVSSLLAMAWSSIVPNYISLIGVQVPFVFLLIAVGVSFLLDLIISIHVPQWIVPTSYLILMISSVILIILLWKRESKRDIMVS